MLTKLLLLFFTFSFLFRTDHSFDQDLGRHLKLGEIIVKTGQVPKTNLFSYTNPDFPFINTHWLFEVLAYFFDRTIGLPALLLLKIVIILVSVWIVLKLVPKENTALLLPIGFIFLHVLRERLELRPEIFSFLFTAITYFILETSLRSASWRRSNLLFVLPFIQLIWINTHIYFFVGLLLQAIFLIHSTYLKLRSHILSGKLKLLSIIFVLSVIVSFINPNGVKGVLYPLNVTKNYGYTIVENQTMFLLESINFRNPNFLFVKISAGIILLSILLVILNVVKNLLRMQDSNTFGKLSAGKLRDPSLITQDDRLKNILLAVSGVVLALYHVRSFPYLVFLSLPATLGILGPIKWGSITKFLSVIFALILIMESYFYLNGDYYRLRDDQHRVGFGFEQNVKGAMDFVLAHDLPGLVYNNFDIGSYVLYRGYPKYQVFIDGRPEAYPAQFFTGIYIPSQSDYKNFKEVEKLYGLKTIIFSHTDQTPWGRNFLQNVVKDPDWKVVYIDDFIIVLVSLARLDLASVGAIDLAKLNPNSYKFDNHISYLRIGLFLLSTGYTDSGRQFIQKTLQIFPDSPIANQLVGNSQKSKSKFFW